MIVTRKGKFYVVSEKKGKRKGLGGPYRTRKEAQNRLNQVEMFKHMRDKQ
jgi:hypothetical protein